MPPMPPPLAGEKTTLAIVALVCGICGLIPLLGIAFGNGSNSIILRVDEGVGSGVGGVFLTAEKKKILRGPFFVAR